MPLRTWRWRWPLHHACDGSLRAPGTQRPSPRSRIRARLHDLARSTRRRQCCGVDCLDEAVVLLGARVAAGDDEARVVERGQVGETRTQVGLVAAESGDRGRVAVAHAIDHALGVVKADQLVIATGLAPVTHQARRRCVALKAAALAADTLKRIRSGA